MRKTLAKKSVFLLFLFIISAPVNAQVLSFDHYSIKDGLPSNWITTIFQDRRGYLWLGGDGGLSVYDGLGFKNYNTDDGLPVGHVWCIQESQTTPGMMLVGTHGGGLSKFREGEVRSILLGNTTGSNTVSQIYESSEGVIWCGTNQGVYRVSGDSASFFATANDSGWVPILREARRGGIWISIGRSLYHYSPASQTNERVQLGLPPALITCMVEEDDGTLWLGTVNGMLHQVRHGRVLASRKTNFGTLFDMLDDGEGNLWVATNTGLLRISKNRLSDAEIIHYSTANGFPDSDFTAVFGDRENNLWFATRSQGLIKISTRHLYVFSIPNLKAHALSSEAVADTNGHLFAISDDGLWEIWKSSAHVWQKSLHALPAPSSEGRAGAILRELSAVAFDREGLLWIGLRSGGLYAYQVRTRHHQPAHLILKHVLSPGADIPPGELFGMIVDRDNQLWYNIRGAPLVQVDLRTRRQRAFLRPVGGTVRGFCQDLAGNLWFGTFSGGVAIVTPQNGAYQISRHLTVADGLVNDQVRSLVQRRNGEIWIGTRFHGVSIYKDGEFRTLSTKNGLLNNAVWVMAEDDDGRMWIGTSVGLQYTAPDESQELFVHQKLYGKHFGALGIIPKARALWGASRDEVTIYEYGHQPLRSSPPYIYITGMRVNGKERALVNHAEFAHDENAWRVDFAGLSFKEEKALRYRYRLRGLEETWQEPTNQRNVTYASLQPGHYVFEVTAFNLEGAESDSPATLAFTILPPFWQRWWFIAFCLIIIGSVLYAIHMVRLDRLLEIEKIRARIATDLHDDIGAGLTHIGLLSQVALQRAGVSMHDAGGNEAPAANGEWSRAMQRVGNIARELSAAMSDVVWSVNPRHDSMAALQRRLHAFASEICEARGIALRFETPAALAAMKLHPEIRRDLLLIAKEALHNAVKYSASPVVLIRFALHEKNIRVEIMDEGNGFDPESMKNGNGLNNMRSRAEKLGGFCEITSAPGRGARVRASVPLKK